MSDLECFEIEFKLKLRNTDVRFYRLHKSKDGVWTACPKETSEWINGEQFLNLSEEEQDLFYLHEGNYLFEKGEMLEKSFRPS